VDKTIEMNMETKFQDILWSDRLQLAIETGIVSDDKLANLAKSIDEEKSGASILESKPGHYTFEVTNRCNLRCALCPTKHNDTDMPKGFMDLDYFKRLIDSVEKYAILLTFQNWGEPLLHPNIIEMVEYASQNSIFTVISSNFSQRLDSSFLERLMHSGLNVLHIDVDGTTQEVYERYRIGGNLDWVLDNLRKVVEIKSKSPGVSTLIETAMIVSSHNEHQLDDYRELMNRYKVDRVEVSRLQLNPNMSLEWLPSLEEYRYNNYTIPDGPSNSCERLYNNMIVNWDGRISPCALTYDAKSEFAYSPAPALVLEEWNNSFFQSARRSFKQPEEGDVETICKTCQNCLGSSSLNHFRDTFAIALREDA